MVYDGGKLRSSIVSVIISSICGMRVMEPQNIILFCWVWVHLAACCQGPSV